QDIALAEDVAVDERRPEILGATLVRGVLGELHPVLLRQIAHHIPVARVEVVAALEADADDLLAVARMAPRVVAELRMEREVEVLRWERAHSHVVAFLA